MMQLISYFPATCQRVGQGLRVDTDANGQLSDCGVDLADQRAPARRLAAMDGRRNTADGQSAGRLLPIWTKRDVYLPECPVERMIQSYARY